TDSNAVETEIGRAHAVIDRLEALRVPSVAVIHGFCLGGGLEVALACQMRIAISDARFGFPEVMLGLHPGLGGTARFTELVNPMQAMTLMLTGRTIDARRAKSLGLVDAVCEERHVRNAVKAEPIAGAMKRAADLFGKIKRRRTAVRDALDQLIPDMVGEGVRGADLIIEAVPEKLELKQKVYASIEPKMKPGAILATNTSS